MIRVTITWTVRDGATCTRECEIPDKSEFHIYYGDKKVRDTPNGQIVCITSMGSSDNILFWGVSESLCHFVNEGGKIRKLFFRGYKKIPESDVALYAGDFGGFQLVLTTM